MAITKAKLRANLYTTIYTHLNTNVTDPKIRSKQWMFSSFPDYEAPNFIGYPIIVIDKAKIDKAYETFDNSNGELSFPLSITVFSPKGADVDSLSDSVDVAMAISIDDCFTFSDYSEDEGQITINGKSVHHRTHKHIIEVDL